MKVPPLSRFTWKIDNFSRLHKRKHCSDNFILDGFKWRILIFSKGNNVICLCIWMLRTQNVYTTNGVDMHNSLWQKNDDLILYTELHNDPISVAFGGLVMTKFTIALREIGAEVLRSQDDVISGCKEGCVH